MGGNPEGPSASPANASASGAYRSSNGAATALFRFRSGRGGDSPGVGQDLEIYAALRS